MEKLIQILEKFDSKRSKSFGKPNWNEEAVAGCFLPCAEQLLCEGYFRVNGRFAIDLGNIELYYHEEDTDGKPGKIKDPIMYHTNDHQPYSMYKKSGKYPYFVFGSFNLHQSGVDVTFENPEQHYRASFLIRSYRLLEKGENESWEELEEKLKDPAFPEFNPRSTHIFDDLFPEGICIGQNKKVKIEWAACQKGGHAVPCKRKNVFEYEKANGVYIKEDGKYKVGKEKEQRNWGFKREGIKEFRK